MNTKIRNIGQFLLDVPQLFLREALENPYKFMIFTCLLIIAVGAFLPVRLQEIPAVISHLQVEMLMFLVFGVFVLAQKNKSIIFSTEAPLLGRFLPWIQRHATLLTWVTMALIFAGGLSVRLWHLAILDPYTDENAHLLEAVEFLRGDGVSYERSRFISGLIYLVWLVASPSRYEDYIFWSRVPSTIAGALTLVPLFLVARRISVPVALTSALMWATSPWAIGVSRYAREYAFYPLVILFALNAYLSIVEAIQKSGWSSLKRLIPHALVLILFCALALIDVASTLKVGFLVLAAAITWHICEFLLVQLNTGVTRRNRYLSYIVVAILVALGLIVHYGSIKGLGYNLHPRFLKAFLVSAGDSPTMWWSGYTIIERIPAFFIFIGGIVSGLRKDRQYFLFFSIFVGLLFFYYMMFDRYFRPRYCYYILPFYIIVISTGLYYLASLVKAFHIPAFRFVASIIIIAFLSSLFNYRNVQASVSTVEAVKPHKGRSGYFPATGEYHQEMRYTLDLLKKKATEEDVFITTVFQPILMLGMDVPKSRIFRYPYKNPKSKEKMQRIIREHPRGWMILDKRRHGKIGPVIFPIQRNASMTIGNRVLRLIIEKDETYIYRWRSIPYKEGETPTVQ